MKFNKLKENTQAKEISIYDEIPSIFFISKIQFKIGYWKLDRTLGKMGIEISSTKNTNEI